METMFLGIVIFLFLLAIFDLAVGVSNDAVNFLNSAIGSKAASFRLIITIAAIGVFFGAILFPRANVHLPSCHGDRCDSA